jgi:hypothetical protein
MHISECYPLTWTHISQCCSLTWSLPGRYHTATHSGGFLSPGVCLDETTPPRILVGFSHLAAAWCLHELYISLLSAVAPSFLNTSSSIINQTAFGQCPILFNPRNGNRGPHLLQYPGYWGHPSPECCTPKTGFWGGPARCTMAASSNVGATSSQLSVPGALALDASSATSLSMPGALSRPSDLTS